MSNLEASNVIALERPAAHAAEKVDVLRHLAEQVRNHSRSSTKAIIAIGEALRDAKLHLGHGKFGAWVATACGFTMRTAQNYVRAAELADKSESVSLLNPAAIYRLAKASTPPDVVNRVLEMLETGVVPTEQEIIGLILAASLKDQDATESPTTANDEDTLRLACELHTRLGHELVSQLIESRWSDLRKHLRRAISQPGCGDAGEDSYSKLHQA
jgi:hypothetical protein